MARADHLIENDVVNQLQWDNRVDETDIHVEVSNGVVNLTGSVPRYLSKKAAEADAQNVFGVIRLANNLQISHPPNLPVPSDDYLRESIQNTLMNNPDVNMVDLEIMVNGGIVNLEGTVDAYWKKIHTETLIELEPGVVGIENHLAVVPTDDVSDQIIASEIVQSLEANPDINAEDIDVTVERGIVTLTGIVPGWNVHKAAYEAALYKSGVIDVKNLLVVSGIGGNTLA